MARLMEVLSVGRTDYGYMAGYSTVVRHPDHDYYEVGRMVLIEELFDAADAPNRVHPRRSSLEFQAETDQRRCQPNQVVKVATVTEARRWLVAYAEQLGIELRWDSLDDERAAKL